MASDVTTVQHLSFQRRADPDPPVAVGEELGMIWLRIGPFKIVMANDPQKAIRTMKLLRKELDKVDTFDAAHETRGAPNGNANARARARSRKRA